MVKEGEEKMTAIQIKVPNWLDLLCACPLLFYRLLRFGHLFRKIPLGEGKFTLVDPLIFYRLNLYHWTVDGKGDCIYAVRHVLFPDRSSRSLRMHREIINAPPGLLVDHKNNNTLDNRIANLRLATSSQNNQNRRKLRRDASSRFIGVSIDRSCNRYRVQIHYQGKRIYIGRFLNELDAARAYDEAARKYHGEFARLNFKD
jgi:hypothetical protein